MMHHEAIAKGYKRVPCAECSGSGQLSEYTGDGGDFMATLHLTHQPPKSSFAQLYCAKPAWRVPGPEARL